MRKQKEEKNAVILWLCIDFVRVLVCFRKRHTSFLLSRRMTPRAPLHVTRETACVLYGLIMPSESNIWSAAPRGGAVDGVIALL
jgi:hypothetical protein